MTRVFMNLCRFFPVAAIHEKRTARAIAEYAASAASLQHRRMYEGLR
jgi:hypothetical protein